MRFSLLKPLNLLFAAILTLTTSAQDTIFMKDGSKIISKVTEITPDWVKYKNWSYKEGPTYYLSRFDVEIIKYPNGSKDEFTSKTPEEQNPSKKVEPVESINDKFSGEWYPSTYNGTTIKTTLTVRKMEDQYLVVFAVSEQADSTIITSGSFKELGKLNGSTIELNNQLKISLIDSSYLLMNSTDFFLKEGMNKIITGEVEKFREQIKAQQKIVADLKKEIDILNKNIATTPSKEITALTTQIRTKSKQLNEAEKKLKELNEQLTLELKRASEVKLD